jgi:hypothetical protein
LKIAKALFPLIVPDLSESHLEQVEQDAVFRTLGHRQEAFDGLPSVLGEVLPVGEKVYFRLLIEPPLLRS